MSNTSQRQIRILHVDDEPNFTDLTATFLERESDRFVVETATSADEGLEIITDSPPDCVISDYNMPGRDGLEFLQAVREDDPDLPFILYTGKGSEAVAGEAIAADVTDYLQKESGSSQYELLANRIRNAVQARREAQRAERREQLMRLTEVAGDTGGFELDVESGRISFTHGTRQLLGLSDDADLSFEETIELYHPEDRADVRQTVNQAVETGEKTRGTWRLQALDGHERLVEVTITPATATADTHILRGAIHDVTELRERQEELNDERRFIQQALDSLNDLFYVCDENGALQRWNERVPEVTGYTESELADMDIANSFPENEQQKLRDATEAVYEDGNATFETELLTVDGKRLPYEFTGGRLTDEDGTQTGLVGIGRDLTERRQRERRFRALVEESNDIISVVDADGQYQYQSPSIERILGHAPEDTVGDNVQEYIHPDDYEAAIEEFETWVRSSDKALEKIEYRARHADGSWRWMEARGTKTRDHTAGERYVVNSRDITDRRERQQELQQTRDLLANMEELVDAGAWEYDSDAETLMITNGVRRLYGLDPDAALTLEAALDAVHPEDRDHLATRLTDCLETGEPYDVEVRLNTAEGAKRWLTARGERISRSDDGSVVRGYIRDITEEKERE